MPPGRPAILADQAKQAELLTSIAAGATRAAAASHVGVHVQTVQRMIRTDPSFRERWYRAQAQRDMRQFKFHTRAGNRHRRAAAWKLQRACAQSNITPLPDDIILQPVLTPSEFATAASEFFTRLQELCAQYPQLFTPSKTHTQGAVNNPILHKTEE